MTAKVIPQGKQQYFASGTSIPLSGGKLWTYAAGTSTPKQTWADAGQVTPNANPIILDSRGEATVYWNGNYKVVLMDSADTVIWTVDNVSSSEMTAADLSADDSASGTLWTTVQGFITKIISSAGSSVIGFIQAGTGAVAKTVQRKNREVVSVYDYLTEAQIADAESGSPTLDLSSAINGALSHLASLSAANPVFLGFPSQANQIYRITSQLSADSDANVGICGMHGMPKLLYAGAAIATDGPTGAVVYFSGTDHSFGGIHDMFVDANSLAAFCIYAEGIVGNQFRLDHIHWKNATLDGICLRNSGTRGVLSAHLHHISAYATTTFAGKIAPSGRYGINIDQNVNSGIVKISDSNMDVSVSGCIAQQGQTFGGYDVVLDGVRFETNFAGSDLVVQKFATAGQYGSLTARACKSIDAGIGTTNAIVHNISTVAAVGNVLFDPVMAGNAPTYLFQNDNDTTKTVTWDSSYNLIPLLLDGSQSLARFNRQSFAKGPTATPYAIAPKVDFDKLIHNNNIAGALSVNLPSIATVGQGYKLHFSSSQAAAITLVPDGTDAIRAKASSATLVSAGLQGDSISIMSGPGSRWYDMGSYGTWS